MTRIKKTIETQIFIHSFLISNSLPSTAKALLKELNKITEGLGNELEEEAKSCNGSELLGLVRAKIEFGRENR